MVVNLKQKMQNITTQILFMISRQNPIRLLFYQYIIQNQTNQRAYFSIGNISSFIIQYYQKISLRQFLSMNQNHLTDQEVTRLIGMFDGLIDQNIRRNPLERRGNYEKGKKLETKDRKLKQAMYCYALSAQDGQKIQSSIKDFASLLHQCGRTRQAVKFLQKFKEFAKNIEKYNNLVTNLKKQINPSGKFLCKKILLANVPKNVDKDIVLNMFKNSSRIQSISFYTSANFEIDRLSQKNAAYFQYCIVNFESFSAAKKTLETFDYEEWFGIDKYWMDINNFIVCWAQDGKTDFERTSCKILCTRNQTYQLTINIPQQIRHWIPSKYNLWLTTQTYDEFTKANAIAMLMLKEIYAYYDEKR